MPFRFRLQRVLGVRESFERQRAIELARAAALERAASDEQRAAEQRVTARRAASTLAAGQAMPAGMLHNLDLTVQAADQEVEAATAARAAAAAAASQSNDRYIDARRERRVLERLRDERHETWQDDESRSDRRAMDDVARSHVQRQEKRTA